LSATVEHSVGIFNFIPSYREAIYEAGKEPMLVVLVSFLVAFAATRGYTRLARKYGWGSGSVGGVHLHHSVPGLILALIGGFLAYTPLAGGAWVHLFGAVVFGVGAALVLDEFALIFHLRDVYWSQEGRSSIDATIMGAIACGVVLVVSAPFGIDEASDRPFFIAFPVIAFNVIWALTCFLKSKPFTGIAGIAITPLAFIGAFRLAKPNSPWAHKFYAPIEGDKRRTTIRAHKLARATARIDHGFGQRCKSWLVDLVGGKPSSPPLPRAEDIGPIPFISRSKQSNPD
jgi:hypothetical protein